MLDLRKAALMWRLQRSRLNVSLESLESYSEAGTLRRGFHTACPSGSAAEELDCMNQTFNGVFGRTVR